MAQTLVQNFIVTPNELNKETEYITHNITMTNQAFGLDKIETVEFPAAANLSINDLDDAQETIDNIRVNDFRPARTIFNQLQSMRPYYDFYDVDVDRYKINGKLPRFSFRPEINQNIPPKGKTGLTNTYTTPTAMEWL